MTWEEKFAAIGSLSNVSLMMRWPGNWYVSGSPEVIERGRRGFLVGRYGNGETPQEAVENHWSYAVDNDDVECIVLHASDPARRREVNWNGFMFVDAPK